jgi:hypothetical protein
MQVDHPAEWELAIASGIDEQPRCVFADRYYHRLEITWRKLNFKPNLELVLQRHRRRSGKNDNTTITDLKNAPPPWRGVIRKTPKGKIVNAVRFLENARWLTDVAVAWPESRDAALENAILTSVKAEDPDTKVRLWDAMGISMSLGRQFDLVRSRAKVGRVAWDFATEQKKGPRLTVERIALPDHWLKGPLRDWLIGQMPAGHKMLRQNMAIVNNHRGEELLSRGKITPLASMRGLREIRMSVAWLCPVEARVYQGSITAASRQSEICLPGDLNIRCCGTVPSAKQKYRK